jgi:excisionase family DNA binding protein
VTHGADTIGSLNSNEPVTVFMTVAEVAARWKMSERSVRRLIHSGDLAATVIGPRQIRVAIVDVQRVELAGFGRAISIDRSPVSADSAVGRDGGAPM